jgi:hypothetical protein
MKRGSGYEHPIGFAGARCDRIVAALRGSVGAGT